MKLSGGQKQRLGIARALYRKPKILILDEATSSLDTSTEKDIINSINYLKNKLTIIIVTHRLNTIKNCEKVFLIKDGKIIDDFGHVLYPILGRQAKSVRAKLSKLLKVFLLPLITIFLLTWTLLEKV